MHSKKHVKRVIQYPYKDIGDRIRTVRQRAGLTQVEFAEKIDMSIPNTWKLEHGAICPQLDTLEIIRDRLGADPAEIMFGTPSVQRESSYQQVIDRYARRRGLPASAAALLKRVQYDTMGIVGEPTDDGLDRIRMLIETNVALSKQKETRR